MHGNLRDVGKLCGGFLLGRPLELYLPALLGGLEQVSAFRGTAGGDSRRGGLAAPAEAEPTTSRRRWRNTWRNYGGWLICGPGKVRRETALDDLSASSFS